MNRLLAVMLLLAFVPAMPTDPPSGAPVSTPTVAPTAAPTRAPTTATPTVAPTTATPTTATPSAAPTTATPTVAPTTATPTVAPTTATPTVAPTTATPTVAPTIAPTRAPTTATPTVSPTTAGPTVAPTTPAPTVAPTSLPEGSGLGNGYPQTITVAAPGANNESSGPNISLVVADGSGIPATVTVSSAAGNATVGFEFTMRAFSKRGHQAYAVRKNAVIPEGLQIFMAFEANASSQPAGPLAMKISYNSYRWISRRRSLYMLDEALGTWVSSVAVCANRSMTTVSESDTTEYIKTPVCHFSQYAVFEETHGRVCAPGYHGCRCESTSEYRTDEAYSIVLWISAGLAAFSWAMRLVYLFRNSKPASYEATPEDEVSTGRTNENQSMVFLMGAFAFLSNVLLGTALVLTHKTDTTHLISGTISPTTLADTLLIVFGAVIIAIEAFGALWQVFQTCIGIKLTPESAWIIRAAEACVFFLATMLLADTQDVQVPNFPHSPALYATVVFSSVQILSAVLMVLKDAFLLKPLTEHLLTPTRMVMAYFSSRVLVLVILALLGTWQPCNHEIPASVNALGI